MYTVAAMGLFQSMLSIAGGAIMGFVVLAIIAIPMVAFEGWLDDWLFVDSFSMYCQGVAAMGAFGAFVGAIAGLAMALGIRN